MEPITIITTALALAAPFLQKTGENIAGGIAESVGEDIWNLIKSPFTKNKGVHLSIDLNHEKDKKKLENLLLEEVNKNERYKQELENAIKDAQEKLNANQQIINNKGKVGKQMNIQNNFGDINFQ